jgi:hypothetical protein
MNLNVALAFYDNADPGAGGYLVLAVWFVVFVLVLNTIIFFSRRLFRRWRSSKAAVRHGDKRV